MSKNIIPFFSVIIPVYNIEHYIAKCIDSILKQSFFDYEIILVDDGSVDGSGLICDNYEKKFPEKIKVIHSENQGVSSARNLGIKNSKGEFLVFVDGDDETHSLYLETFHEMISKKDTIDLAICGVSVEGKNIVLNDAQDSNGLLGKSQVFSELVKRNSIRGFLFNKAFRYDILKDNKIQFDETAYMCEDLLFCVEFSQHLREAYFVNKAYYDYVQRTDSAVHQKFNEKRISVLRTYQKIVDLILSQGDFATVSMAYTNMLIHNVDVFFMLYRHEGYVEILTKTREYILKNIGDINSRGVSVKTRLKVFYVYVVCVCMKNL